MDKANPHVQTRQVLSSIPHIWRIWEFDLIDSCFLSWPDFVNFEQVNFKRVRDFSQDVDFGIKLKVSYSKAQVSCDAFSLRSCTFQNFRLRLSQ